MLYFIICQFIIILKFLIQFPFPFNPLHKNSSSKGTELSKYSFGPVEVAPDFSGTKKSQYFKFDLPARQFLEKRFKVFAYCIF